tara:strand:+ start:338 stop:532 length:195 start_codon:yes stop_codon:yes gene_type:complete
MPLVLHGKEAKMFEDDLDVLIKEHSDVFPEGWDGLDIADFCCRYVLTNIEDVKEWFNEDDDEDK